MKSPTTVAACTSCRGETTAPTWSGRRRTQTSSLFAGWQTTSKVLRSLATALQTQSLPLRKSELRCPVICLWVSKLIKDEQRVAVVSFVC